VPNEPRQPTPVERQLHSDSGRRVPVYVIEGIQHREDGRLEATWA